MSGLNQSEKKNTSAEDCLKLGHQPVIDSTAITSRVENLWHKIVLEAISIQNKPLTDNKDLGFNLDSSWKLVLWLLDN